MHRALQKGGVFESRLYLGFDDLAVEGLGLRRLGIEVSVLELPAAVQNFFGFGIRGLGLRA